MFTPEVIEGELLKVPSPKRTEAANVSRFISGFAAESIPASSYENLWDWSIQNPDEFWTAIWNFAEVKSHVEPTTVRIGAMPSATWFPGVSLNYAERALNRRDLHPAIIACSEVGTEEITYAVLVERVRKVAAGLRKLGVSRGDRVAAYLPSRIETVVAFLATASLGAIWTICSPDLGSQSVLDRFQQIEPKVLITVPNYLFGGRTFDRSRELGELVNGLPSLTATVLLSIEGTPDVDFETIGWDSLEADTDEALVFERVPFDHPLWVVYTSGTTGPPKSIVHGHGGIILEHHKLLRLHLDLSADDRFFWFTTTGWVMWNIVVGGLLVGMTIILYDGSPTSPTSEQLWDVTARTRATFFGSSAGFIHAAVKEGQVPTRDRDLTRLRSIGITGSPLSPAAHRWLYRVLGDELFVASISGGTDVCTAFIGASPLLPQRAGRLQAACLGVAAACFDENGAPVIGQVGELVVTQPIPSMPVRFWNDPGGKRYRQSYFDDFPGVWRHGDWVSFEDDGSSVIYGRSDATLNRGGVRMGTSEFYNVLDTMPEIQDCVVIDTTAAGTQTGQLILIAVLGTNIQWDDGLRNRITTRLKTALSPRHAPDAIFTIESLPHTLNGKRLEVPIRRLFLGQPLTSTVDVAAVDSLDALRSIDELAQAWLAQQREV
jgi:acetoacetyl-CoA synthetase